MTLGASMPSITGMRRSIRPRTRRNALRSHSEAPHLVPTCPQVSLAPLCFLLLVFLGRGWPYLRYLVAALYQPSYRGLPNEARATHDEHPHLGASFDVVSP